MSLLTPACREDLPEALWPLWDECERTYPAFRGLWSVMANSPTIFRHIWGELLELRQSSPVAARHFETGIVVVSTLARCQY